MPLDLEDAVITPTSRNRFAPQPKRTVGLGEQLQAGFGLESDIGTLFNRSPQPDVDPVEARNYTIDDKLNDEERTYSDAFNDVFSDEGLTQRRVEIANEMRMKETLADGPLPEWLAGMAGSAASLSMFIPVAGPLAKGGTAVRAASSAVRIGTSVAVGAGVQEAILQSTQLTRTKEEGAASILGAFILGGALGAVAGSLTRGEVTQMNKVLGEARPRLEADIVATIRGAGLGDFPPPRTGLYDTTAVARFLDADNSPNFKLPRVTNNALADRDLLNYVGDTQPAKLDAVSKAMREVEVLQDRISRLEADPTLFVTRTNPPIRDKPTLDILAVLDKSSKPEDAIKAAQIREGAQPAVTLNRLLNQMDEATAKWQEAEQALEKSLKKTREQLDEIGANLGPKEMAEANGEIVRLYAAMKQAIDEGKDPLSLKPKGDPLDWLRGFAKFPGEGKARTQYTVVKKIKGGDTGKPADVEGLPEGSLPKDLSAAATGAGPNYKPVYENVNRLRNSLGAAQVSAFLKKIGMASPSIELSMSRFETSRETIQRLIYTGMATEGHFKGIAAPDDLHTEITRLSAPMRQVELIATKSFDAYKAAVKAGEVPEMSRLDFYTAVGTAMTKGDTGPHKIISDAAKAYRQISDHFKKLAQEYGVGVFKEGDGGLGKTAQSHLYRAWSKEKIQHNPQGFKIMAQDYFTRTQKLDADEAAEVADSIMHKILGSPDGHIPAEIKVSEGRGAAKERTFKIPDDFRTGDGRYATEDFVDRNAVNVMARYVRSLAADIAYQKILGGEKGLKDIQDRFRFEADEAAKAAGDNPKLANAIMKDFDRENRVIEELVHRIRGTDPHPADPRYAGLKSASKMLRDFNVVRVMGSSIISQMIDVARPVMVHGMARVFGSILGDALDGFKLVKLSAKDAQRLNTANDLILGGRAGSIADMAEPYTRQSKAEILSGLAAHKALKLFGMSHWTVWQKARISYMGTDDMLRRIDAEAKGKPLDDKWRTRMSGLGLGKEERAAIARERANWDEGDRGYLLANVDAWKDREAANRFSNALLRHIDDMVITPTAADKPLWMHGEVGKALTQFQSFGWATHQRILIAGLQQRDFDTVSGVAAMITLGIFGTALRDIIGKGEIDKTRSTAGWMREGVDRSGVLSRFMETEALLGKATGVSPVRALTGEDANRYANRGFIGQALGPTAGLVDDTAKALRGVATSAFSGEKNFTGSDLHNIRRIAPLQNFILFKGALDKMEENLVNRYGLEPRQIPK